MGLLVLQIQQEVMEFLVQCCQVILQDLPVSSLADSSIPVKPEPAALLSNETAYPSLAAMAADTPYRVPAHLDFRHLRSLVAARASAAADHIEALREDPGYFSSVVGDYSEHRQETLIDTDGKRHPVLTQTLFWDRVAGNAIVDAYTNHLTWGVIHKKVADLERLQQNYSGSISPQKKLPEEYQQALLNFSYLLDQSSRGPIHTLKVGVPSSPQLRSHFVRSPQEPNTTVIKVQSKSGTVNDELLRLFRILWDDQQTFLYGLPNVMDELERLVGTDREQKKRLSGWVTGFISDLALLAQMKNQLNLYQPWASTFEQDAAEQKDAISADFSKSLSSVFEYMKGASSLPSMGRLVTPLREKFNYPVDKPRTRDITDTLREAETNLDLFWKVIDKHFDATCHNDTVKQLFLAQLQPQRTPPWVEPAKTEKVAKSDAEEELLDNFSRLSAGNLQAGFEAPQPRNKVKTRGLIPRSGSDDAEIPQAIPQKLIPDQQPRIVVGRRPYKVFSTLFYVPNQTDRPGDVSWSDFLHAMASTGFQIEQLYGSVWQFTPTKLDVENSIQFHEPHPSGKIPYPMARRHGRRLYRTYGWTIDIFTLA
jgi:hypothetical protein